MTAEASDRESPSTLGERAVRGVVALGVREGGMKLVSFTGDIALYRLLTTADFGVVVPIAFLAGIIKQFTDVGLQPSVISLAAMALIEDSKRFPSSSTKKFVPSGFSNP